VRRVFLKKGVAKIVAARPIQKPCNAAVVGVASLVRRIDFALQQTLLTILLKGQWHFLLLLCIGAAGKKMFGSRA
jgi:hypothetical protein